MDPNVSLFIICEMDETDTKPLAKRLRKSAAVIDLNQVDDNGLEDDDDMEMWENVYVNPKC
jgi:hypothetical protein